MDSPQHNSQIYCYTLLSGALRHAYQVTSQRLWFLYILYYSFFFIYFYLWPVLQCPFTVSFALYMFYCFLLLIIIVYVHIAHVVSNRLHTLYELTEYKINEIKCLRFLLLMLPALLCMMTRKYWHACRAFVYSYPYACFAHERIHCYTGYVIKGNGAFNYLLPHDKGTASWPVQTAPQWGTWSKKMAPENETTIIMTVQYLSPCLVPLQSANYRVFSHSECSLSILEEKLLSIFALKPQEAELFSFWKQCPIFFSHEK
jgi:hypothetical protein